MSDIMKHSVSFKRTKNLGDYNSVSAELTLEFDGGPSTTEDLARAEDLWNVMAAAVYERLDIAYEIDPESGAVTEDTASAADMITSAFKGATTAAAAPAEEHTPIQGEGVGSAPPFYSKTNDKDERRMNKNWAIARLRSHPGEFFDNTKKKETGEYKENAADYTHKDTRIGVWL